ncbi:hypothetical protein F2P81_003363 [Scophthalmus maximus]|uniref:Uncharacterized protein n=1 Tax=Scophthalmus maximus TaxID=52904 RepID=A0A6A4TG83_SCOMX|nr:hypothetical protein F2P81_003363 [Scophthalmus maximus]
MIGRFAASRRKSAPSPFPGYGSKQNRLIRFSGSCDPTLKLPTFGVCVLFVRLRHETFIRDVCDKLPSSVVDVSLGGRAARPVSDHRRRGVRCANQKQVCAFGWASAQLASSWIWKVTGRKPELPLDNVLGSDDWTLQWRDEQNSTSANHKTKMWTVRVDDVAPVRFVEEFEHTRHDDTSGNFVDKPIAEESPTLSSELEVGLSCCSGTTVITSTFPPVNRPTYRETPLIRRERKRPEIAPRRPSVISSAGRPPRRVVVVPSVWKQEMTDFQLGIERKPSPHHRGDRFVTRVTKGDLKWSERASVKWSVKPSRWRCPGLSCSWRWDETSNCIDLTMFSDKGNVKMLMVKCKKHQHVTLNSVFVTREFVVSDRSLSISGIRLKKLKMEQSILNRRHNFKKGGKELDLHFGR